MSADAKVLGLFIVVLLGVIITLLIGIATQLNHIIDILIS
jgi:hypothetical protein